jgi:glycosyltransferase involved in cell wall biosynthesis
MKPRRITLVANEVRGAYPVGGAGTATTFLALALARAGHDVEILHSGTATTGEIEPEWARAYARAGVRIRFLDTGAEAVEPQYFAGSRVTEQALRADPPDVVIAQDGSAAAHTALRLRRLGLGFERTLFVVFCHGTRGWIKDVSRNVRVFPNLLGVAVLERQSIELADVVVSPSAYLLGWMRRQGWQLPREAVVIPYLTRSAATGESTPTQHDHGEPLERIVFFGRLDERKGVRPFVTAVNALDRELLERVELEFLGAPIPMTPEQVEALISEPAKNALRGISFQTELDQHEALSRLSRAGSLAVMPSLEDNSPNTVYECLEYGIPFIASRVGGTHELVADGDRDRVLFEPTADSVEKALRQVLTGTEPLRPALPAFDPADSLAAWQDVLATPPSVAPRPGQSVPVDVVVAHHGSREALARCLAALGRQTYGDFQAIVATAAADDDSLPATDGRTAFVARAAGTSIEKLRRAGLDEGSAPYVVFLDDGDTPAETWLETLVTARSATGADVVTCGLLLQSADGSETVQLFSGEPGGLGVLGNGYGTVALVRRTLLQQSARSWPVEGDPDWPLLAGLGAEGAHIVSVPLPLVTRSARPGAIERDPSDALLVVDQLERTLPDSVRSIARLAAGLAADAQSPPTPPGGTLRRVLRRLTAASG